MKLTLDLKHQIYQYMVDSLNHKIDSTKAAIRDTSESMKNDTKSSAGDKFETGREMMQIELNNKQVQLNQQMQLLIDLQKVDLNIPNAHIGFGSLVQTQTGIYFISVAMGKVSIDNQDYYALSLASPVGQVLKGKKAGDTILFQGKKIELVEII